jgi:2-polyprenyl-3-methyl-5-hydroxy-6-metoxy-1,4-benzoquinol methylase
MRFFQTMLAYQQTAAMEAALDLDLFTAIAQGNHTAETLAAACQASIRGTRSLCDALVVLGFLEKHNNKYSLSPDSAMFLDRNSRTYVGTAAQFLGIQEHRKNFERLAEAVRKGGTVAPNEGTMAPEHPMWVQFARGMAPLAAMLAEWTSTALKADTNQPWKVLDIAAGHGMFGISIARHNPQARIVGLDWAPVLEVAKEHARKAGVQDRYSALPGSVFDVDLGNDYDVVLLPNFIHHFDAPTNEKLLRKIHAALKPGGRVAVVEFVVNDDRISPPAAAMFTLTMLVGTSHGDAYTYHDIENMLKNSGFKSVSAHPTPTIDQQVIIGVK